jgi:hypothetical protein
MRFKIFDLDLINGRLDLKTVEKWPCVFITLRRLKVGLRP